MKYFTVRELNHGKVSISVSEDDEKTEISYVSATEKYRHVRTATGHAEMFVTLKTFCHLFNEVSITTYDIYNMDLIGKIAVTVNNHCSSAKQEIGMTLDRRTMDFTFEHATIINLRSIHKNNLPALNKNFPAMERLSLNINEVTSIKCSLPFLKHFDLNEEIIGQFDFKIFAKHNPQITSLRLKAPSMGEYFKNINELFPQVDTLYIAFLSDAHIPPPTWWTGLKGWFGFGSKRGMDTVYFNNVKHLTLELVDNLAGGRNFRLTKIQYPHVESYTFKADRKVKFSTQYHVNLITNYKDLINVDVQYPLSYGEIVDVVEKLPKLQPLTLQCDDIETVNYVLKVMEMDTDLATISVNVNAEWRELFVQMAALIGEWSLRSNPSILEQALVFERNTSIE